MQIEADTRDRAGQLRQSRRLLRKPWIELEPVQREIGPENRDGPGSESDGAAHLRPIDPPPHAAEPNLPRTRHHLGGQGRTSQHAGRQTGQKRQTGSLQPSERGAE